MGTLRSLAASFRMRTLDVVCAAIVGGLAMTPGAVAAQGIPFSQHGAVEQRVAFTDIAISYNRPTARGRVIWGDSGIVKWSGVWHPGADSATRISFSRPVTFEGRPLAAGSYSVWTMPHESGTWTVILNSRSRVFHTPYPGEATDVLRVDVQVERGPHMESLAWYFPAVARDSTVLRLHWGEVMVPLRIRVSTEPPN
jgi:hypothetical protein